MVILIKILPFKHLVKYSTENVFSIFLFPIGSIPINCTVDYGDGYRQTNGTSRDQYYTAYFSRNYTRYGQYNVSARCYNDRSSNTTQLIRKIRREKMNRKMIVHKDLMETPTATRFNLLSYEDYSFRHSSCLYLKNMVTNEKMKLIWRKKTLEIIPNDVNNFIFQILK
jgi:hypothetical protein